MIEIEVTHLNPKLPKKEDKMMITINPEEEQEINNLMIEDNPNKVVNLVI